MATNYDKLVADLNHANQVACQSVAKANDGGTANRDAVFLRIPRAREASVLDAIRTAGLYCRRKSQWIGQGYFITPTSGGQGDKHRLQSQKPRLSQRWSISYNHGRQRRQAAI